MPALGVGLTAAGSLEEILLPNGWAECILEHYRKDGMLTTIIEGREAAELYISAIYQGLMSRLDHAAYLGRELARAEHALSAGTPYVQDAAHEHTPASTDQACHVAQHVRKATP